MPIAATSQERARIAATRRREEERKRRAEELKRQQQLRMLQTISRQGGPTSARRGTGKAAVGVKASVQPSRPVGRGAVLPSGGTSWGVFGDVLGSLGDLGETAWRYSNPVGLGITAYQAAQNPMSELERLDRSLGITATVNAFRNRDPLGIGLAVGSVLPVGRVANVAARAGRVAFPLTGKALTGTRRLAYGAAKAQFPSSPSLGTALGQRGLDIASKRLGEIVDPLRSSESRIARGVGAALTYPSSRARVPKQIGKNLTQEQRRTRARLRREVNTIATAGRTRLPGVGKKVGFETAHSYWQELPREYRNAQGLIMIRDKIAAERARYIAGDIGPLNEFEKADIPAVIADQTEAIEKLTRTATLAAAGRIKPDEQLLKIGSQRTFSAARFESPRTPSPGS